VIQEEVVEEPAEVEEDEVVAEHGGEAEADLGDGDESDVATNWNVPTWQELIASLYRPER